MFPTTSNAMNVRSVGRPMYKFVVGPPVQGCVAEGHCNSSEPLIPWKNFYPVYSRSNKINYISQGCASCHGVTDGIEWTSRVSFLVEPSFNRLFEDLSTDKSPRKYLLFVHPGNESENMQGICSLNTVSSCTELTPTWLKRYQSDIEENFPNLNIFFENFQDGCLNGPHLPIFYQRRVYKNLFCVLCGRIESKFVNRIGAVSDSDLVFSAIIDGKHVHQVSEQNSPKIRHVTPIACKVR